jgi:hypothetical protein
MLLVMVYQAHPIHDRFQVLLSAFRGLHNNDQRYIASAVVRVSRMFVAATLAAATILAGSFNQSTWHHRL